MQHIMQRVKEVLRVGFKADVAAVQGALKFLVLGEEGIFAVGTERVALQEEGMGGIAHDFVVGVLAALGHNIARHKAAIVIPEAKIGGNVGRIADFLERQHIRPEGVHKAVVVLFQQGAQGQPRIHQQFFPFFLGTVAIDFGIVVVAEDVTGHGADAQAGAAVHFRHPLGSLHKALVFHVFVDQLHAARRTGHGKQRLVLVMGKHAFQVLHDHGKARIIVPFLLWQHEMQGRGRWHGRCTFDGSYSAHGILRWSFALCAGMGTDGKRAGALNLRHVRETRLSCKISALGDQSVLSRRMASSVSSGVPKDVRRIKPSPQAPKPTPGVQTSPAFSRSISKNCHDVLPAGTDTHR